MEKHFNELIRFFSSFSPNKYLLFKLHKSRMHEIIEQMHFQKKVYFTFSYVCKDGSVLLYRLFTTIHFFYFPREICSNYWFYALFYLSLFKTEKNFYYYNHFSIHFRSKAREREGEQNNSILTLCFLLGTLKM